MLKDLYYIFGLMHDLAGFIHVLDSSEDAEHTSRTLCYAENTSWGSRLCIPPAMTFGPCLSLDDITILYLVPMSSPATRPALGYTHACHTNGQKASSVELDWTQRTSHIAGGEGSAYSLGGLEDKDGSRLDSHRR